MELCSFWVINPADGQEGKPEPVKLVFFENGDIDLVSLCADPEYRGAYKLPSGSYSYSGEHLFVSEENLGKIKPLVRSVVLEDEYREELLAAKLISVWEWDLFYSKPIAWKNLRIVGISFGDEQQ